jgi:hypothetical protein
MVAPFPPWPEGGLLVLPLPARMEAAVDANLWQPEIQNCIPAHAKASPNIRQIQGASQLHQARSPRYTMAHVSRPSVQHPRVHLAAADPVYRQPAVEGRAETTNVPTQVGQVHDDRDGRAVLLAQGAGQLQSVSLVSSQRNSFGANRQGVRIADEAGACRWDKNIADSANDEQDHQAQTGPMGNSREENMPWHGGSAKMEELSEHRRLLREEARLLLDGKARWQPTWKTLDEKGVVSPQLGRSMP